MIAIFFILGLLFGSFINAAVWRLHEHKPLGGKERSQCPKCGHTLKALDLLPVVSWLWLKGRCRYCKAPISWQYPMVELLTGGLFALSYAQWQLGGLLDYVELSLWLGVLVALVILAVYDYYWMELPDQLQLIILILAVAQLGLYALSGQPWQVWASPVLAAVGAGGGFFALHALSKGAWMGGGDVKLVFNMGLLLGVSATFVALFIAFNTAAFVSLVLIGLKLRSRRDLIPFGPFLIGGLIAARLFAPDIIQWYLRLVGV